MLIQNTSSATPQPAVASNAPAPQASPVLQTLQAVQPAPSVQTSPTAAQLQRAIQNTNQAMQDAGKSLTFSVDQATHETVVKLTDTQTNQVIGQFPSKQMLAISEAIGLMQEQLQQASISRTPVQTASGLLIQQKA